MGRTSNGADDRFLTAGEGLDFEHISSVGRDAIDRVVAGQDAPQPLKFDVGRWAKLWSDESHVASPRIYA